MTGSLFFIDEDEVLAHHGVKGMKWGVRKQRPSGAAGSSRKKRKGLSRKQKAAIAGVLGTAAAVGAGYYLHKSGNGKKIAAAAKRHGASARDFAKGKGRNLGAQARVKRAQAKRQARALGKDAKNFAGAQKALGQFVVADTKKRAQAGGKMAKAYARGYGKVAVGGAKGAASRLGSAAKSAGGTAKAYARGYGKVAAGSAKGAASRAGAAALKGADRSYFAGKKAVQTTRKYAKNKAVQAAVAGAGVGTAANVGMRYAANKALNGGGKKRRRRR